MTDHPAGTIIDATNRFLPGPRTREAESSNSLLHGFVDEVWGQRSPFSIAPNRFETDTVRFSQPD